jgi:predicted nucleotidyltransferase
MKKALTFPKRGRRQMKTREGDLIETRAGIVFDVKGLVHPPDRVIAFIRYFPDEKGDRKRNRTTYGKVYSLSKRYELLRERFPQYLVYDPVFDETLCEVPVADVEKHYKPIEKMKELRSSENLDPLASKALKFAELLREEADIPRESVGISGSILVDLQTSNSDVDPIIYGSENCRRAYSALRSMIKKKHMDVKPYASEDLKRLFDFRSKDTDMKFEDFVRTESRKVMQGKFEGTDYFVRFVKNWGEIDENYGDIQYRNVGYSKIEAIVVDDSEATFTPCTYAVEKVKSVEGPRFEPIEEIASFRGRFCEQAASGEKITAQGKVERATNCKRNRAYFRLLVGNKPSDYIAPKN